MFDEIKKAWRGDDSVSRAFWLWGIAGNSFYILFFLVWPLSFDLMFKNGYTAFFLGGGFLVLSQCYMIFSFVGGMRTVRKQPESKRTKNALLIIIASILFVVGEFLWVALALLLLSLVTLIPTL